MPGDRMRDFADRVWYGDDATAGAVRVVLAPAAAMYAGIAAARNALYDRGVLAQAELELPAISVGNLSVGGTGKTPVAAWFATKGVPFDADGILVDLVSRPAWAMIRLKGADEVLLVGGQIAPIFFNTMEDAGALPIECAALEPPRISHLVVNQFVAIVVDTCDFVA